MAEKNKKNSKNEDVNWEIRAFEADAELADYHHEIEAGLLSEEEMKEREEFLDELLGTPLPDELTRLLDEEDKQREAEKNKK